MTVMQSAVLGLIQGLGEFLPISSSGHLLLARLLFGINTDTPAMKMLDILLHAGTLIPVFLVFRSEWIDLILHPFRSRSLFLLFSASVPTLAIYLLAKTFFPSVNGFAVFDNGWFLGSSFLLSAFFLLLCDSVAVRSAGNRKIGFFQAVLMGIFQGVGMIPGVSRSGSTILGGVTSGLNKTIAARFSFMMSVPAVLGSMLMEGKDALEQGYISELTLIPSLAGIVVSAVAGYCSIRFMLRIISRFPLSWFALYLAVIGIIYLYLQYSGSSMVPPFTVPVSDGIISASALFHSLYRFGVM